MTGGKERHMTEAKGGRHLTERKGLHMTGNIYIAHDTFEGS